MERNGCVLRAILQIAINMHPYLCGYFCERCLEFHLILTNSTTENHGMCETPRPPGFWFDLNTNKIYIEDYEEDYDSNEVYSMLANGNVWSYNTYVNEYVEEHVIGVLLSYQCFNVTRTYTAVYNKKNKTGRIILGPVSADCETYRFYSTSIFDKTETMLDKCAPYEWINNVYTSRLVKVPCPLDLRRVILRYGMHVGR